MEKISGDGSSNRAQARQQASKWTPGPWIADDGDGHYWAVADQNGDAVACMAEPTLSLAYRRRFQLLPLDEKHENDEAEIYSRWDEQKANAHLMAAAPEMAKLLQAASHALRSYQYGNSATELAQGCADQIDALLAKARAESPASS